MFRRFYISTKTSIRRRYLSNLAVSVKAFLCPTATVSIHYMLSVVRSTANSSFITIMINDINMRSKTEE